MLLSVLQKAQIIILKRNKSSFVNRILFNILYWNSLTLVSRETEIKMGENIFLSTLLIDLDN